MFFKSPLQRCQSKRKIELISRTGTHLFDSLEPFIRGDADKNWLTIIIDICPQAAECTYGQFRKIARSNFKDRVLVFLTVTIYFLLQHLPCDFQPQIIFGKTPHLCKSLLSFLFFFSGLAASVHPLQLVTCCAFFLGKVSDQRFQFVIQPSIESVNFSREAVRIDFETLSFQLINRYPFGNIDKRLFYLRQFVFCGYKLLKL